MLWRVRWGNVGRAAGVAGLVALVVAWPRLGSPEPELPGDAATPVAEATVAPVRPVAPRAQREQRAPAGRGVGTARERERDAVSRRQVAPRRVAPR
ncbi:MAG: hypothetical protein ACR2L8_04005, partial [Solirubrobacteraceae bacterium]